MRGETSENWEVGLIGGPEKRVIEIVSHSPDWSLQFKDHAERIKSALGEVALQIEHIGSTSVEGLAAKPIIDILVVVADPSQEELYVPAMLSAGYELRVREPDFDEHRMFRTPERDVHIHFYPQSSGEIERYLIFRDFLRADPDASDRYADLKRVLSAAEWKDMNEYADAKTKFIEDTISHARS
jgi:GrpB-like predicted nucleotidyltransferase (UPF0157 family)